MYIIALRCCIFKLSVVNHRCQDAIIRVQKYQSEWDMTPRKYLSEWDSDNMENLERFHIHVLCAWT